MKKININSNITINWKIWRGINKTSEEFAGSNLRVFLIGTENTYSVVPKVNGSVLEIYIPQGSLTTGAYDLKAIWEKNGGRTLMSSTRSNIFGITEAEEANPKDEVIQIVSYVESYGRDGLSAFEIAVMRGMNRGYNSEKDWLNMLYASGGEGGGGAAILGTEITIGGTALGDDLLNREDELEGHLKGNKLDSETPLNLLFKALLYKAKEVLMPDVKMEEGGIEMPKGNITLSFSPESGARPKDKVTVAVTYNPPTDEEINRTPSHIYGMEWGYAEKEDGSGKHEGENDKEIFSKLPDVGERTENGVVSIKVNGSDMFRERENVYTFNPVADSNNSIVVEYDAGRVHYTIEEIHVWPLNSAGNVYSEEGIKQEAVDAYLECGTFTDSKHQYPCSEAKQSNFKKTQGGITFTPGSVNITNQTQAEVGKTASFKVSSSFGSCTKTDSSIKNESGKPNYGYKTSATATEVLHADIKEEVQLVETAGSLTVTHNGKTISPKAGTTNDYEFVVTDGSNTIEASLIQNKYTATAKAIAEIYPLNEDGEAQNPLSTNAVNDSKGGTEVTKATWTFSKMLPAKLIMAAYNDSSDVILNKDLEYADSSFDITDNTEKVKYKNLVPPSGAPDYPWTVLIPKSRENATIAVWKWIPVGNQRWAAVDVEFELIEENYTHTDGVVYSKYYSDSSSLTVSDLCVKIKI